VPEELETPQVFMDKNTGKVRIVSKKTTKQIVNDDGTSETAPPYVCEPAAPESGEIVCFSVEQSYPDHISDSVVQAQSVAMEPVRESFKEAEDSTGAFAVALKRFFGKKRQQEKSEGRDHAESNGAGSTPNLGVAG